MKPVLACIEVFLIGIKSLQYSPRQSSRDSKMLLVEIMIRRIYKGCISLNGVVYDFTTVCVFIKYKFRQLC